MGVAALRLHRPARLGGGELGAHDAVVKADLLLDAVVGGGLLDVVEDRGSVGDRLVSVPGAEGVAEGVHVGVRADAGVAEEVPGPADAIAGLEDRVGLAGAVGLQVAAGADAGQSGPDDQHVNVFERH